MDGSENAYAAFAKMCDDAGNIHDRAAFLDFLLEPREGDLIERFWMVIRHEGVGSGQTTFRHSTYEAACAEAGQPLTLRRHAGYDHGYYFIASFIEDHLRHHATQLGP